MTKELSGWSRARPVRTAFVVADGDHGQLRLDGIFADAYWRWGGRFSLIVPCRNGEISEAYWRWLEGYDPDIVYAYADLSRETILRIHERVYPSEYLHHVFHGEPRLDVHGFKPDYRSGPISSLSTIFKLARYARGQSPGPIRLLDSWFTERPTRWFMDNFGTYNVGQGGSIFPPDAKAAASLLSVVSPENNVPRRGIPPELETVPSEFAAYEAFAGRRATSLSLLSASFAPKLNFYSPEWGGAFNLVVGDSFDDRLLFWNARLLTPEWLDPELSCFRVTMEQLRDPAFLAVLGQLLKSRNLVNSGGGGQAQLAVRSISCSEEELAEARELITSTRLWGPVRHRRIASLDDFVPTVSDFQRAQEGIRYLDNALPRSGWQSFTWTGEKARPPITAPEHLVDAPARQAFATGLWGVDLMLEQEGTRPWGSKTNRWLLPKRWRMAGAFKIDVINDGGAYSSLPSRTSRNGNLTALVHSDHPIATVTVPSPEYAIHYALEHEGSWEQANGEHELARPRPGIRWMRQSNEANYLIGVLGMAGGLRRAGSFLLHPFLRETLSAMGGTPSLPIEQAKATADRLQKRVRHVPVFDLQDEIERNALTDLIVKAARQLPSSPPIVRLSDLKANWLAYRREHLRPEAYQHLTEEDQADHEQQEISSIDSVLIEMRRTQMVFQGHRWTCDICYHKNWSDMSALAPVMSCEVCHKAANAPIEIDWQFRANEFLIESLRDHSTLSLIWTLSSFADRSRNSFMYGLPTCFGFSDDLRPNAEADLLIISDGKTYLCEIKSSWRFRASDISKHADLAIRLRPDFAVFAVMENGMKMEPAFGAARERLEAEGIGLQIVTPADRPLDNDPWLSYPPSDDDN